MNNLQSLVQEHREKRFEITKPKHDKLVFCVLFIACAVFLSSIGLSNRSVLLWSAGFALLLPLRVTFTPQMRKWIGGLLFAIGPFLCYSIVELLNSNNPWTTLDALQITLNLAFYILIFFGMFLAVGRLPNAATRAAVICTVLGAINHYVYAFRGRTLFPGDMLALNTVSGVISDFDFTPDTIMWQTLLMLLFYIMLLKKLPKETERYFLPRRVLVPLLTAAGVFLYVFFGTNFLREVGIEPQQWITTGNGFVLNFTTSLRYSRVSAPVEYTVSAVNQIVNDFEKSQGGGTGDSPNSASDANGTAAAAPVTSSADKTGSSEQKVNIVAIMSESFADLSTNGDLQTNEDPFPFIHSLRENTVKGYTYSAVTGGGTANCEYEFLTGNSTMFLPSSTVAYQMFLKDKQPSLVSQMNELGYHTIAFHPFRSAGWNRVAAYRYLGFDNEYFEEDCTSPRYVRNYIGDESDYENVIRMYEESKKKSDQPVFLFNVSMQNHSSYTQSWRNLDRTVYLTSDDASKYVGIDQYLSLLRATDDATKKLIEYFSNVDEPTIIVFFGDHQPPLDNSFYASLYGKELNQRTIAETENQYMTPFFMWANYDIEEKDHVILSQNYLSTLLTQTANIKQTEYQKFLSKLYEQLPVMNGGIGFIDNAGKVYEKQSELTEEQQEMIEQYRLLAYNSLFDTHNRVESFFTLSSDDD